MSRILTCLLNWYSLQIYSKHPRSRLYSSALKKVWVVWTWALNCVVERRQKSLARSEKVLIIKCTCASSTLSKEFSPNPENSFNFLFLASFFPVTTGRIFSHFRRIEMFSPILPLACATNVLVFFLHLRDGRTVDVENENVLKSFSFPCSLDFDCLAFTSE